jgi:hypothetical protein
MPEVMGAFLKAVPASSLERIGNGSATLTKPPSTLPKTQGFLDGKEQVFHSLAPCWQHRVQSTNEAAPSAKPTAAAEVGKQVEEIAHVFTPQEQRPRWRREWQPRWHSKRL